MAERQQPERPDTEGGMQILINNVPGGVFSCLYDVALTILQANEGFLSLLGYTREELRACYRDSFWEMIDPRDRVRVSAEVRTQMQAGPNKEIEYRMCCKDGRIIWVLDKGRLIRAADGTESFCCVLVDITRSKALESKLRLSLERHQIIMDQAADIIFEWDIVSDTAYFSHNWEKKFGYAPLTQDVRLSLHSNASIYPADRAVFAGLLQRIEQGTRYGETELRLRTRADSWRWFRVRLTGQQDESGRVIKAVGVFIDIDNERQRSERLLETARRDVLTKLNNRGRVRELITDLLEKRTPESCAALFILDLDNFKVINDTMGHLCGDALLVETARTIRLQFRDYDVVGRVGGDEFIVFLYDQPDGAVVARKAEQLIRAVAAIQIDELPPGSISCSVGVALCPDCGENYLQLFRCADEALYQAKKLGKNQYAIRNPELGYELAACSGRAVSAVSARIDSETALPLTGVQFTAYLFELLYRASDLARAIGTILEIVGKQFDVSRVYIFETTEDASACLNTFEWCNRGIPPEIGKPLSPAEDGIDGLPERFDEDGIYYCRDVQNPAQRCGIAREGVKSMLQCAMLSDGIFRGYVGFDACHACRFWTQEQINTFSFVAKMLSVFLLKYRARALAQQNERDMETLLSSRSDLTLILAPESHKLLYANRSGLALVPDAAGQKCEEIFQCGATACALCPVRAVEAGAAIQRAESYSHRLERWLDMECAQIHWKGKAAILVTCRDSTTPKNAPPPLNTP